jgi:hypothetical protein
MSSMIDKSFLCCAIVAKNKNALIDTSSEVFAFHGVPGVLSLPLVDTYLTLAVRCNSLLRHPWSLDYRRKVRG